MALQGKSFFDRIMQSSLGHKWSIYFYHLPKLAEAGEVFIWIDAETILTNWSVGPTPQWLCVLILIVFCWPRLPELGDAFIESMLKGTASRDRFKNVDKNLHNYAYRRNAAGF
jgi:hypothetical protein